MYLSCPQLIATPWGRMGEKRYSVTILVLNTRYTWVDGLMPRPLYPRGNSPGYPSDRKLGGPQGPPGRCIKGKRLTFARNRYPAAQPAGRCSDSYVMTGSLDMFLKSILTARMHTLRGSEKRERECVWGGGEGMWTQLKCVNCVSCFNVSTYKQSSKFKNVVVWDV
jgi:hypothetical protein